jgi:hypothetical protein
MAVLVWCGFMPNLASQSLTRLSTLAVSLPAKVFTFITSPSGLVFFVHLTSCRNSEQVWRSCKRSNSGQAGPAERQFAVMHRTAAVLMCGIVLNLRAAKTLGLDVPDKLLALADEVIE